MKRNADLRAFSDALREYMKRKHKNVAVFSDEVGISESYMSRLLSGKRRPSRNMIHIIGYTLQLSLQEVNKLFVLAGHRTIMKKRVPTEQ